ncbi:MAG TPA: glycosyltransferase family 4 protein [Allosphingosinicella sp.]|nr:glycosyltransferase family 4 protein [Allosphingosinicella sp.]
MHILVLTHYYPPEVNAPASRISEMARAWVEAGERVTIVTCAPNHPRGEVFPGYRNRFARQEVEGVEVIRLPTFLAANEGFGRRLINYLSYPLSLLFHLPLLPRPDIVVSTSPQFFCGLSGVLLKRRRRPWVLEIRDLWPESIVAVGAMRRGAVIRLLERIERLAYRKADALVSVTDSFVPHLLAARDGQGPVEVIKNGVDLDFFEAPEEDEAGERLRRELGLEGKFVAAYVGTHGMAHGLDTLLKAAERLIDDERIAFLLVGDGAERDRLERKAKCRGLTNVRIAGQRPKSDMPAIWQATDVSLVLLRRLETFKSVLPSKIFEAMAMRRPIVLGLEGEARTLIEQAGAGIAITPESADELVEALHRLAGDPARAAAMGESGRRFVETHFDRSVLAGHYRGFLETLVAPRSVSKS